MASTAAGAAPLKLKFIFANHDGVVVECTTESGTLVKDLKLELVERWPSGLYYPFLAGIFLLLGACVVDGWRALLFTQAAVLQQYH